MSIQKETAVLLRKKGFTEWCSNMRGEFQEYEGLHHIENSNKFNNDKQFSAPTHTELQTWFREKHEIEVYVKPTYFPQLNRKGRFQYIGMILKPELPLECVAVTGWCEKYEEAFEDALVLALNLIEKQ
jgi:hypothetical protein